MDEVATTVPTQESDNKESSDKASKEVQEDDQAQPELIEDKVEEEKIEPKKESPKKEEPKPEPKQEEVKVEEKKEEAKKEVNLAEILKQAKSLILSQTLSQANKDEIKKAIEAEMELLISHMDEAQVGLSEASGADGAFGEFTISEKTKQTIEILEDVPYSYEDWIDENVTKDSWSTKILKFWFLFSKKHNVLPEMQFP